MMFRRNGKKGNYAYTVARVKAKKSLLMKEEDYSKMMMMTVPEMSRYISETGYQKEMVDLAVRSSGLDLLEHATYTNMAKVFSTILEASEGELNDMLSAYLAKWDIWNMKVILRGKSYGLDANGIKEDLVPAGSLSAESLDKLIAIDSQEDIIAAFGKMAHVIFTPEVLAAQKAGVNLEEIEDYLDKFYYTRLVNSVDTSSRPSLLFLNFVRQEIDLENLETILKLKVEGIRGDAVLKYIIPEGKHIDMKLATQLANAESIEAMIPDLAGLDFYENIKDALPTANKSLLGVLAGLKGYAMQQAKKFSHLYPLSVIPVLDFMIHKENEVDNIRIIARGTESGLSKEEIKALLVI